MARAVALRRHVTTGVFDGEEATARADAVDYRLFLHRLLQQRRVCPGDAYICKEDFEPAELRHAAPDHRSHVFLDRCIDDQRRCDPPFASDCRCRFLGIASPANDQYRSALTRETDRARATDSAAAARHDRTLAFPSLHPASPIWQASSTHRLP